MTGRSEPRNAPYVRRYGDPASRPSSQSAMARYDRPTRERITELVTWMDCADLIAEAEQVVRAQAARAARQEKARGLPGVGAGEPGE